MTRPRAIPPRSLDFYHPHLAKSMSQEQVVAVAISLLAGSEVLSMLPGVRANGWLQLIFSVIRTIATFKPRK